MAITTLGFTGVTWVARTITNKIILNIGGVWVVKQPPSNWTIEESGTNWTIKEPPSNWTIK